MENVMVGFILLFIFEGDVNNLMQQVVDDYGFEVFVGLFQVVGYIIFIVIEEKVDEDDLFRRFVEFKVRG